MPTPNKGESREAFVSRFMGSEEAKKTFPDEKQRLAVAYSVWKKHSAKGKETDVFFKVVKTKEDVNSQRKFTFIGASTLPDRTGGELSDGTKLKGEILSKNVLDKFASFINDESRMGGDYGSYRTISLFHNRVYQKDYTLEEAGYVIPGSAKVAEMPNSPGNFALYVDTEINSKFVPPQEYPDYTPDKIEYKIDKGVLGLSLEYNNEPNQERIVSVDGEVYRYILDSNDFRGFGFARADLIGNTSAVRVKEATLSTQYVETIGDKYDIKNKEYRTQGGNMEDAKTKEMEEMKNALAVSASKLKELQEQISVAKQAGTESKVKELNAQLEVMESKFKELKLKNDETAAKLKESIELAFSSLNFASPAKTKEDEKNAKVKEAYAQAEARDFIKFKEIADAHVEANATKIKELFARDGPGFDFERWGTLQVKCKGSRMVVVPSPKTKDVIDSSTMDESTYYQTNAMFADRYVAGITETFLKNDALLAAMPKEQHIGGNDKYQWRMWVDYQTVTGDTTLAVDPNVTAVDRSKRSFIKVETRICEYRDGVEVTDFTAAHSMAAVGDLLGIELQRAAEAVTESMSADLFKPKTDATSGWNGFVGLIGVADSGTYTTLYGKTRSAANRLLDATTANTFVSTSEGISVPVVRKGYEKVLAHGSRLADIALVMHPTQCRRLFDSEDAAIRNNILTMAGAPATFGFNRSIVPYCDGIPIIRDYYCESSAAAADMFVVVDLSTDKGFNLVVSKPLGARGLAKVGTSESAYVSFWGCAVYKSPRNVFAHTGLLTT